MNQPWKMVLLLLGIYIVGGVTGAFVMARVIHERVAHRPMPEQWAPMQLKRLAERLDLSADQQAQLEPIVKRNMDELRKLRTYSMAETRTVFERMEREIAEKLTPEQRAKYEQMNKEMRERGRRFWQNRPPGGPGGPRFDREFERERHPGEPGRPPPEKPPGT
jgi:Spy/CpxP family protein refolding chaperone